MNEPCPGHGRWESPVPISLAYFIAAVLSGKLSPYPQPVIEHDPAASLRRFCWTAPVYAQAAAEQEEACNHLAHLRSIRAKRSSATRERTRERARYERSVLARQATLRPVVADLVHTRAGYRPYITASPDPAWAWGLLVKDRSGAVCGVICPAASRISSPQRLRLAEVIIFVASEHEYRELGRVCARRQRFHLIPTPAVGS